MNLQKCALVAEIVGSIAVVVTLVVLIFEVRGNTEAIRAGNRQSIAERSGDFALAVAGNPELSRYSGPSPGQRHRYPASE